MSAGLTPTISWTPRCRLAGLFVEAVESGGDVWAIEAGGSEGISSGVVYGTVPTGAAEDAPAEATQSTQATDDEQHGSDDPVTD